jgi:DHA1 family bicyclomycin/chloramphenicol resistance-like MFS transporter
VLALDAHGKIAGTASAMMGTAQFVTGAIIMAVVGQFVDGTARPMLFGITACALTALTLVWFTLIRVKPTPVAA